MTWGFEDHSGSWPPTGSFQGLVWELACPQVMWRLEDYLGLGYPASSSSALALFRVQLGSSHAQKWCEDLMNTWGRDLPLTLFRVHFGSSHAHKWCEDLNTTWGGDLPLALFRVQLGSLHTQKQHWPDGEDFEDSLCEHGWCSCLLAWTGSPHTKSDSRDR